MLEHRGDQESSESFSTDSLKKQWTSLITELSPTADPAKVDSIFQDLIQRYSEPTRAYHTPQHLFEMLALINANQNHLVNPTTIKLATWFHDAIYNSQAHDNEEKSAELSSTSLAELEIPAETIEQVAGYILLTKQHDLPAGIEPNADLAFFLDADMSILASDTARYMEYARAVAFEYSWAKNVKGKDLYTLGRLQFLQCTSGKPIFHTNHMKPLEAKARVNIDWEIEQLQTKLPS